jgi:hypothetical protein
MPPGKDLAYTPTLSLFRGHKSKRQKYVKDAKGKELMK